jgi:ankyrin repeat protein
MNSGEIRWLYEKNTDKKTILESYGRLLAEKDGGISSPGDPEELTLGEELAFMAANFSHPEALEYLFNLGVDPQAKTSYAFTLLHEAAKRSYYHYRSAPGDAAKTAELLLDKGVSALRKDDNERMCCYHYAARTGLWEFVEALARRGTRLNMTDKEGNTGIHIAADYVRHKISALNLVEKALQQNQGKNDPASLKILAEKQQEAAGLWESVEAYFKTVKAFADAGVDRDEKNEYEKTAREFAVASGANKIAAFLAGELSAEEAEAGGEEAELKLAAGGKDLFDAVIRGDYKALEALVKLGADLNGLYSRERENNFTGLTPLGVAVCELNAEAAELLLKAGADPAFRDAHGRAAPAYFFCVEADIRLNSKTFSDRVPQRILRAFTEKGFDLNSPVNDEGDTLLNRACASVYGGTGYNSESLRGVVAGELIAQGADPSAPNNRGETALMWACRQEQMENLIISFLESEAAPSGRDREGNTALHYAAMNLSGSEAKTAAELLLDFCADPRAVNNEGKSPLDIATENKYEALVKLLLNKM